MELSNEQLCALQQFENGDNLFITGEGGTGKTTLIHYLITSAFTRKKKIQLCAMTGCAALLLACNARTIHSWSGIRLAKGTIESIIQSVLYSRKHVQNWKTVDILVVDEISMMSKRIFDLLNEIGKCIRKNNKPFGGIQVVFCGDFYQLPPVATMEDIDGDKFCFESSEWYSTFALDNHIVLTTMFRQKDSEYRQILTNIRKGKIDETTIAILSKYVNRDYHKDNHNGCIPVKLFPTRSQVETLNTTMFNKIDGQCYNYDFVSKSDCKFMLETNMPIPLSEIQRCSRALDDTKIKNEINSLINNSTCVRSLLLKKGASVMCTVNLDIENGICNGSTGVITDFMMRANIPYPIVKFSNGVRREIPIKFWQSEEYPVIAVGQFPLCLAWAMTIHKIQGATLDMAEIDIGSGIFECGQTYVALSRVKTLNGLYLTGFDPSKIKMNQKVKQFYQKIPEVIYETEEQEEETVVHEELDLESYACTETDVKMVYL
jgi:ATP-dependent DNA helicase PIF1